MQTGYGLWVPPGVIEEEVVDLRPVHGEPGNMARRASFSFRYKGRLQRVWVIHDETASPAEIEDEAARIIEDRILELKEEGYAEKRPPTAAEKKEIGKIMNDFKIQAEKRRAMSEGRIYRDGIEGVNGYTNTVSNKELIEATR